MSKSIEITVDSKGKSEVETKGFSGSECLKASRFIAEALGEKTQQRKTAEFYQVKNTASQQVSNDQQ